MESSEYMRTYRHTTNFHTNIFPRTVGLAPSLYEYAQPTQVRFLCILPHECQSDALLYFRLLRNHFQCDLILFSISDYYKIISNAIEKLVHSSGTQLVKQARCIDELLDRQVESMTKMETSAEQIVNNLRTFSAETKADQIDASHEDKKLNAKLTKYQGNISSFLKYR